MANATVGPGSGLRTASRMPARQCDDRFAAIGERDGVGGTGSVFLLLDEPEVYGLPPDPEVPSKRLPEMFRAAGLAGVGLLGAVAVSFIGSKS